MQKLLLLLITLIFLTVSCGSSKKTENNDADILPDEDIGGIDEPDDNDEENENNNDNDTGSNVEDDVEIDDAETDDTETYGLPKCSLQGKTPCYDPSSELVWSSLSTYMTHYDAVIYCYNLEEGGFADWHLPDIDELRTLVRKCTPLETGGKCRISEKEECLSRENCYDEDACAEACSGKQDVIFSKLNDNVELWSNSKRTDSTDQFWTIMFHIPEIYYEYDSYKMYVRCTRSVHSSGESEGVETRTAECTGLPENAQWNTVSSITQTWSGIEWEPDTAGVFNEEATTENCRFKCIDSYFWMIWDIFYNQERGECVPECGKTSASVCVYPETRIFYDKDSGMLWSAQTDESVYIQNNGTRWENAVAYCENLVAGGYDDWHLPNIDELRTLVRNCPGTETGGACNISEVNGELSDTDIKEECAGCAADKDYTGKYSRLGDRQFTLWSSSIAERTYVSSDRFIWGFDFYRAGPSMSNENFGGGFYVRCTRKAE
jgi:hypothetical protein